MDVMINAAIRSMYVDVREFAACQMCTYRTSENVLSLKNVVKRSTKYFGGDVTFDIRSKSKE